MTAFENDTNDDLKDRIKLYETELIKRQMSKSKELFLKLSKMKVRDKFSAIFQEMPSELFIKLFVEDFGEEFLMDEYIGMDDKFLSEKMKRFKE
jgi:hypothetical protein